jgi:hypothetical protein
MRRLSTVILTATLAASLAACGSSSSGGNTGANAVPSPNGVSNPAAAKTAITALYTKFFGLPVPAAKKALQDGPALGDAFKVAQRLQGKNTETAKNISVKITGPATAIATFDLFINQSTTPAIPHYHSATVFVGGQWKVAKSSFCKLVGYGGTTPKGC